MKGKHQEVSTGKKQFLEGTIRLWQRFTPEELTYEDAREITENIAGFFKILLEWETKEG